MSRVATTIDGQLPSDFRGLSTVSKLGGEEPMTRRPNSAKEVASYYECWDTLRKLNS
jgi:hypothetical protein